jgi:hypothetical protein
LDVQEISYPIIFDGAHITNLLCFTMYMGGAVEKTGTCFIGTKLFIAKKSLSTVYSDYSTKTPEASSSKPWTRHILIPI